MSEPRRISEILSDEDDSRLEQIFQRVFDRHREEGTQFNQSRESKRQEQWNRICPAKYRAIDLKQLPDNLFHLVTEYTYQPKGIGIVGGTGTRKTFTMYELLRKQFMDLTNPRSVTVLDMSHFQEKMAELLQGNSNGGPGIGTFMRNLESVDCLYFDDLGQCKFSARVEEEFFALIERRMGRLKPTFWTSNLRAPELQLKFSPEKGKQIVRRLADQSIILNTGPADEQQVLSF